MTPHSTALRHDIVVFGATSFVGQILCRYLLQRHGVGQGLRWAIAARSAAKLEELKRSLGSAAVSLESIVVDAADEDGLRALCHDTRVVVSTVGPYALYGETLVKVCADTGTDYCDLTGEVQWIRRMIERYAGAAAASGARIVHCCGFDSIPSDLGVWFLQREAQTSFGKSCSRVKLRVKAMRGGFSGGTVASLLNVVKETRANPALRKNSRIHTRSVQAARLRGTSAKWCGGRFRCGFSQLDCAIRHERHQYAYRTPQQFSAVALVWLGFCLRRGGADRSWLARSARGRRDRRRACRFHGSEQHWSSASTPRALRFAKTR